MLRSLQFSKQGLCRFALPFCVAIAVLAASSLAMAGNTLIWNYAGSASWATGADWTTYGPGTTGTLPAAADDTWIALSGSTVTVPTGVSAVCTHVYLGGQGPPGASSNGYISMTGGTLTASSFIEMANYTGAGSSGYTGYINLANGLISTPTEYLGQFWTSTINQTGGTNSVTSLILGCTTSPNSGVMTYNLNGGLLTVGGITKNAYGTVHFNLGGGTLQASQTFNTACPMALTAATTSTIDTQSNALGMTGIL